VPERSAQVLKNKNWGLALLIVVWISFLFAPGTVAHAEYNGQRSSLSPEMQAKVHAWFAALHEPHKTDGCCGEHKDCWETQAYYNQDGALEFLKATEHPELLAPRVAKMVADLPRGGEVLVAEIDPTLSDTAAFCEKYQIGMEQSGNCVIVEGKRAEERTLAAVVVLGSMRADINGAVRHSLGVKKVSFAQMEKAVAESEMEFGAITPVGLPASWPIVVDSAVANCDAVIIGSGVRKSKLLIPGSFFASLPNVQIIDLAVPKIV
jgi:prolyl-tRNA editing enzyme YbaK/EbsC (Cys-tRNA(Pro) deacylase)